METADYTVPINKETKFDIHELFFSITDKESAIVSCNDVFVRISGYNKAELLGSFHNIIRHPDMPKIIFKTLWDYLNAGKPIVAYVKNRSKDGGYYWVLAAVFPLQDRYVSIRLKPNTKLFSAVKELYFKLLMAESKGGMEESGTILPSLLNAAGYENYDHFMSDALHEELRGRNQLINRSGQKKTQVSLASFSSEKLKSIYNHSQALMKEYDRWFEKMDMFLEVKSLFEEKGLLLRHLARDIVFLSLNASVSSYKIESGAETFGVLAHDIRSTAKENDILINGFHSVVQTVTRSLNGIVFAVATKRLQIETVTSFIEETAGKTDEEDRDEIYQNISDLIALMTEYIDKAKELQSELDRQIQESNTYLDRMEQQMMYLGYVQVYGLIEAAASKEDSVRFGVIFSQLKALIQETSNEVALMQKMGKNFYSENRLLMNKGDAIDALLDHLDEEMIAIQQGE